MAKERFLILFIIVLIVACGDSKEKCAEFSEWYSDVVSGSHVDTSHLIARINDEISKIPTCEDAYLIRADLYFGMDSIGLAKMDYKKAISLNSRNVYALYKVGLLYHKVKKYDSAIYFFEKAINLKRKGDYIVSFPQKKGILSTDANKYDVPANELFYKQGICLFYKGLLKDALDNFSFCIANGYKLDTVYLYSGEIQKELNADSAACSDFLKAKLYGNKEADAYLTKYCKW